MFVLAMMQRDSGIAASERFGMTGAAAFAFDAAITYRLARHDNEQRAANFKFLQRLIVGGDDGEPDAASDVIRYDKYADSNTQIW